jgi:hypothetical protein
VALAAGGAVLTAAVQISKQVVAPTWLFIALYALAGALAIAAAVLKLRAKQLDEERA